MFSGKKIQKFYTAVVNGRVILYQPFHPETFYSSCAEILSIMYFMPHSCLFTKAEKSLVCIHNAVRVVLQTDILETCF